jgi:hypothetical protein
MSHGTGVELTLKEFESGTVGVLLVCRVGNKLPTLPGYIAETVVIRVNRPF